MLLAENAAALIAFAVSLATFALGYALRRWTDAARAEWAETFAYRQARERTAYGRPNHGGR